MMYAGVCALLLQSVSPLVPAGGWGPASKARARFHSLSSSSSSYSSSSGTPDIALSDLTSPDRRETTGRLGVSDAPAQTTCRDCGSNAVVSRVCASCGKRQPKRCAHARSERVGAQGPYAGRALMRCLDCKHEWEVDES